MFSMLGVLAVFSKNIRRLRKISGLTQEKFAEKIGLQPRSLTDIENGKYLPKPVNIDKICTILNIAPAELFRLPLNAADNKKLEMIKEINEKLAGMELEQVEMFYNMAVHMLDKNT